MLLVYYLVGVLLLVINSSQDLQQDISSQNGTVLSRKRRYLVFPAGSSFQIVFCLTYASVAVGSYFVFGHTAALAYELPSTPLFFDQRDFQKKEDTTTTPLPPDNDHDRVGSWHQRFSTPDDKHTNYGNPYVNFTRIFQYGPNVSPSQRYGGYRKNVRRYNPWQSHMRLDMDPEYYQVHRRTRRDLYRKIENFLNTLSLNGKSCLLKAICELSKATDEKETFMDEFFKAIFRAKPHDKHDDEDDYDLAANPGHNCAELYSTCRGSIRNVQLLRRK